jgi:hypothetical protein
MSAAAKTRHVVPPVTLDVDSAGEPLPATHGGTMFYVLSDAEGSIAAMIPAGDADAPEPTALDHAREVAALLSGGAA